MPNINHLIDAIRQSINTNASNDKLYFLTLGLMYACSQLNLDPGNSRHCSFDTISGEGTGTYGFHTAFYGYRHASIISKSNGS